MIPKPQRHAYSESRPFGIANGNWKKEIVKIPIIRPNSVHVR